ncbi:hypothetical protein ACM26V_19555 [Salipaludibacillus sp. HK11]|uniref:hypothetical protein n=1 Tax=Salipaludibacillus sp. HK11 TaxID=3394320 RepID=UPI0039FCF12B
MGNTIIQNNPYDKRLNVKIEGSFTIDNTNEFYTNYLNQVKFITSSDYDIEVDCTDLNLEDFSQVLLLEKISAIFKEEEFNRILFIFKSDTNSNNHLFIESVKNYQIPNYQLKVV